jgi:hypothetical protein
MKQFAFPGENGASAMMIFPQPEFPPGLAADAAGRGR